MMVQIKEYKKPNGETGKMCALTFSFLPMHEIFICGYDQADGPIEMINIPKGYKCFRMGKLTECPNPLFNGILNAMENNGWDFSKYPDPDLILILKPSFNARTTSN